MSFFKGLVIGLVLAILIPVLGLIAALPVLAILIAAIAFGPILLVVFLLVPNAILGELLRFGLGLFVGVLVGLAILLVVGLMWLVA